MSNRPKTDLLILRGYIDTGDVYTFGLNDHGQLGIGRAEGKQEQEQGLQQKQQERNTALPQLVDFFEDSRGGNCQEVSQIEVSVVKVACGHSHTVVLDGNNIFLYLHFCNFVHGCLVFCVPFYAGGERFADADM